MSISSNDKNCSVERLEYLNEMRKWCRTNNCTEFSKLRNYASKHNEAWHKTLSTSTGANIMITYCESLKKN